MASDQIPGGDKKSEGLTELAKLLEGALERHGASARAIAQRAGIGASHLSKVLKAQRTLRRAKLMILCDLLGLDREKVLRLAGLKTMDRPNLDLGRVTLLRSMERFTLNVVVSARAYDAALFMWMCSQQPLSEVGVDCRLCRAEWGAIPAEVASYTYSVGLHSDRPALFRLIRWSHFTLDRGHALVGRGREGGTNGAGLEALRHRAREQGRRLRVIASDDSLVELAQSCFGLGEAFEFQMISNPDVALDSFQSGAGDLFLGGFAQRLALRGGEFHEIVGHSQEYPRFYAMHSLICSQRMAEEKRALLHAIDALWFDTARRLYTEPEYRTLVFQEIGDLLERQAIEKHALTLDGFELLFSPEGARYAVFAQTPVQLWEEEQRSR